MLVKICVGGNFSLPICSLYLQLEKSLDICSDVFYVTWSNETTYTVTYSFISVSFFLIPGTTDDRKLINVNN